MSPSLLHHSMQRMLHRPFTASRRPCMLVQAKRKSVVLAPQQNPSRKSSKALVDLDKLYTQPDYGPGRQYGPVKMQNISGKGRGLVATQDITAGDTLLVSVPVGQLLHAPEGRDLRPEHLHHSLMQQQLSPGDRLRLQLLFSGSSEGPRKAELADFAKADEKGAAAALPKKGFGAFSKADVDVEELSADELLRVIGLNSWGMEHSELATAPLRGEPSQAVIGVWPEFAMLNHSCTPNTVNYVVGQHMVVRAVENLPSGAEVTTSYLGTLGASPAAVRQRYLRGSYGFDCGCPRCKAELQQPAEVQEVLQAAHEQLSSANMLEKARGAVGSNDSAALGVMAQQLQGHVERLEGLISQHQISDQVSGWLRASSYGTRELLAVCNDGAERMRDETVPLDLAEIMGIIAPGSDAHLYLTYEALVRVGNKRLDNQDPAVAAAARECLRAHLLRYGMVSDALLPQLMEARAKRSFYLGRYNVASAQPAGPFSSEQLAAAAALPPQ